MSTIKEFEDRPHRVVIAEDWERVIDAPSSYDAARFAIGEWGDENGQEVQWMADTFYRQAQDDSYESLDFQTDGLRRTVTVYHAEDAPQ